MHAPGKRAPLSQRGATLVVALVLLAAVNLLALAAMHELSLETAMTAHLAARTQARLSAKSAIELALALEELPADGEAIYAYQLGPQSDYAATVGIRFLGESPTGMTDSPAPAAEPPENSGEVAATPGEPQRYYEILAEVRGPRRTHERRRLYLSRDAARRP